MKQTIHYVSSNTGKYIETTRFLASYAPTIELVHYPAKLDELQELDEKEVLGHKAHQAWELVHKPLLVDDAGCYFQAYPRFPGTLAKPVLDTLGYEGVAFLTAHNDKTTFFTGLAYVDAIDNIHFFRGVTEGRVVPDSVLKVHYSFKFYSHFIPENQTETLTELWDNADAWHYFPRVRALKQFADWLQKQ
jgi:non-canonical purine NTP pyrophosphatase (RdgB/HAM1 family)